MNTPLNKTKNTVQRTPQFTTHKMFQNFCFTFLNLDNSMRFKTYLASGSSRREGSRL